MYRGNRRKKRWRPRTAWDSRSCVTVSEYNHIIHPSHRDYFDTPRRFDDATSVRSVSTDLRSIRAPLSGASAARERKVVRECAEMKRSEKGADIPSTVCPDSASVRRLWNGRFNVAKQNDSIHGAYREYFDTPRTFDDHTRSRTCSEYLQTIGVENTAVFAPEHSFKRSRERPKSEAEVLTERMWDQRFEVGVSKYNDNIHPTKREYFDEPKVFDDDTTQRQLVFRDLRVRRDVVEKSPRRSDGLKDSHPDTDHISPRSSRTNRILVKRWDDRFGVLIRNDRRHPSKREFFDRPQRFDKRTPSRTVARRLSSISVPNKVHNVRSHYSKATVDEVRDVLAKNKSRWDWRFNVLVNNSELHDHNREYFDRPKRFDQTSAMRSVAGPLGDIDLPLDHGPYGKHSVV
eukprot:177037_1